MLSIRGTTTQQYLDNSDTRFQYTQTPGGWAEYNEYVSSSFNITYPPGVIGKQFHCSKEPGQSVSLNFQGKRAMSNAICAGTYIPTLT